MSAQPEYFTPDSMMKPIGPYSPIAKTRGVIMVSAVAAADPQTGKMVGNDVATQTAAILKYLETALRAAGSDFGHLLHVTVFMKDIGAFDEMNRSYESVLGGVRPARTVIEVSGLPKSGALLTMNAMAIEI